MSDPRRLFTYQVRAQDVKPGEVIKWTSFPGYPKTDYHCVVRVVPDPSDVHRVILQFADREPLGLHGLSPVTLSLTDKEWDERNEKAEFESEFSTVRPDLPSSERKLS